MGHGDRVGGMLRVHQVLGCLGSSFVSLHSSFDSSLCRCVLLAQNEIQALRVAMADPFRFQTFTASRSCFVALIKINKDILEVKNTKGSRSRLTFT